MVSSRRKRYSNKNSTSDVGNTDYRSELWKTANLKASSIAYAPAGTAISSPHTLSMVA